LIKKIKQLRESVYLLSHSHNDKICPSLKKGESMAEQLSPEELASFKELLIYCETRISGRLQ